MIFVRFLCVSIFVATCLHAQTARAADSLDFVTTEIPGYVDDEGGAYRAMLEAAGAESGDNISFRLLRWVRAVERAEKSDRFLIIPFSRTPEREERFQWLAVLNHIHVGFVTLGGAINTVEQAKELEQIIVWKGSSNADYLAGLGLTNLFPVSDSNTIGQMLLGQRSSAWFGVLEEAPNMLDADDTLTLTLGEPVISEPVWIAAGLGFDKAPYNSFFEAVERLRDQGFIQEHLSAVTFSQ